jgi:hypothetical protein
MFSRIDGSCAFPSCIGADLLRRETKLFRLRNKGATLLDNLVGQLLVVTQALARPFGLQ